MPIKVTLRSSMPNLVNSFARVPQRVLKQLEESLPQILQNESEAIAQRTITQYTGSLAGSVSTKASLGQQRLTLTTSLNSPYANRYLHGSTGGKLPPYSSPHFMDWVRDHPEVYERTLQASETNEHVMKAMARVRAGLRDRALKELEALRSSRGFKAAERAAKIRKSRAEDLIRPARGPRNKEHIALQAQARLLEAVGQGDLSAQRDYFSAVSADVPKQVAMAYSLQRALEKRGKGKPPIARLLPYIERNWGKLQGRAERQLLLQRSFAAALSIQAKYNEHPKFLDAYAAARPRIKQLITQEIIIAMARSGIRPKKANEAGIFAILQGGF